MKTVLILLIVVGGFFLFIRLVENKLVFFPSRYPDGYWQPGSLGLNLEDCFFKASDGIQLHGWYFKNAGAKMTLLWCHGNAGNISDRLHNLNELKELPINIFIFDYRGYGRSEGSPTEQGVYLDAEAAYDFLVREKSVLSQELVIFGRSLGGAVAVDLASRRPCSKLILESTFTSAGDMAKNMFGVIPVQWIAKSQFNSVEKIKKLNVPVLFFHGDQDRVVPFELGKKLFDTAKEPKSFHTIKNADHNDTYIVGGRDYYDRINTFLFAADEAAR